MTVIFTVLIMLSCSFGVHAEQTTEHLEMNTEASEEETTLPSTESQNTATSIAVSTQPTTEKIEPAEFPALTVNAVSNFFPNASAEYNVKTKQVELTYWFKSSLDVMSVQWYLKYDDTLLTLSEEKNTAQTVCPTIGDKGVLTLDYGYAHYCSSNVKLYDFSGYSRMDGSGNKAVGFSDQLTYSYRIALSQNNVRGRAYVHRHRNSYRWRNLDPHGLQIRGVFAVRHLNTV